MTEAPAARYGRRRIAAWFVLVGLLAAANYAARFAGGSSTSNRDALYSYGTAASTVIFYGIFFAFTYAIAAVDAEELLALRRPRAWKATLGAAIGALVVTFAVEGAVSPLHPGQEQGITPTHWQPQHALPFAVNWVALAIVDPLVEETSFRGVGFGLLRPHGRWLAIVGSGLAFGLAHGEVYGLPVFVCLGLALGYLRERSDSVVPCILVHAFFNSIALVAVLFS